MVLESITYTEVASLGIVCADVLARPVETLPARGHLAQIPHIDLHIGGLAGVTAIVLARLGVRVSFIGKVGADGFGDFIVKGLKEAGVDIAQVVRCDAVGTSATVVLVDEDGERTFLHHSGATAELTEDNVDVAGLQGIKILHWGGPAVTPGLDGEPIGRILKQARVLGIKTSMDTCFDASGKWFERIEHALPHLNIVMSSLEEARHYTGKGTPEAIAEFFLSAGAGTVMVKLGREGLYLRNEVESCRLRAHSVPVVDTTGAGDAACAGFLYGVLNDWDLERSGKMANATGALTVQCAGGAQGVKSLETVLALARIDAGAPAP